MFRDEIEKKIKLKKHLKKKKEQLRELGSKLI